MVMQQAKAAWTCSMEMQCRHTSWTETCSTGVDMAWGVKMDMQHHLGRAASTWTCSFDNLQHGHGHPAWPWTSSLAMDMQHVQYMNMQSERGHAAWIRAYSTDIDMDFVNDMHMDVDIVTCIY
jgi:hypothetical protein